MDTHERPSQYLYMPGRLTRQLQNLTQWDVFAMFILGLPVAIGTAFYGIYGFGIAMIIFAMFMDQGDYVRHYDYVFIQSPRSMFIRVVKKGRFWKVNVSRKSPLHHEIKTLPEKDYALTHHDNRLDTVSFTLTGSGSPFMSMDDDEMREFLARLETDYTALISKHDLSVTIGSVVRLRDWDDHKYREFCHSAYLIDTLIPTALVRWRQGILTGPMTEEEQADLEAYLDGEALIDAYKEAGARDIVMAVVITVSRKLSIGRKQPLYSDGDLTDVIVEVAEDAARRLERAGISDVSIMKTEEAQQFYHEGWNHDPASLAVFREKMRTNRLEPGGHWPQESIYGTTSHVTMDDKNIHGLIRVVGTPETVTPLHMQQIYSVPATAPTITQLTHSFTARGELAYYGFMIDSVDAVRGILGGGRDKARGSRKREQRIEREQFADTTPRRALFDIYIDVAAGDIATWKKEMKAVLDFLESCDITARQVVAPETILHEKVWQVLTGVQ